MRKIVEQPVKGVMMRLFAVEMIDNEPAISLQLKHRPFVIYGVRQSLISIVFALPGWFIMMKNFSPGPICPGEATDHFHLISVVNSDCVMHRGVSKTVSPEATPTIEICTGIASDILAIQPQVHMELIGVGGT